MGALTSKPYAFYGRPWENQGHRVVDPVGPLGVYLRFDVRGLDIFRVLPLSQASLNEDWITDGARFGWDALMLSRLSMPSLSFGDLSRYCEFFIFDSFSFVVDRSLHVFVSWAYLFRRCKLFFRLMGNVSFFWRFRSKKKNYGGNQFFFASGRWFLHGYYWCFGL